VAARLPNFVIVGAMKSGTTSLAQYLGAHPEAFMAAEKELYFFERSDLWERGVTVLHVLPARDRSHGERRARRAADRAAP
jgi:Sulfotransferase family